MSQDDAPQRIAVIWSLEARADLRAIDRETALHILYCLDRYMASRCGDIKKLKQPRTDYRHFFEPKDENAIEVTGVRNRKDAYR